MANKRIELEQYKSYMSLQDERPTVKTVRAGKIAVMVTIFVLLVFLVALAFLSQNLAINPLNILEEPPKETPAAPETPGVSPEGLPGGITPEGVLEGITPEGQGLPPGVSPIPTEGEGAVPVTPPPTEIPGEEGQPQSRIESEIIPSGAACIGAGAGLLAQAFQPETQPAPEPTAPEIDIPVEGLPEGIQVSPEGDAPIEITPEGEIQEGQEEGGEEKEELKGPGQETKGLANLSKLAKAVSDRGLPISALALAFLLGIATWIALSRVRHGEQ